MSNHATSFNKAVIAINRYGFKVIEMVRRKEPKAKFSMRFVFLCYGSNITASNCAMQIVRTYQDSKRKRRK